MRLLLIYSLLFFAIAPVHAQGNLDCKTSPIAYRLPECGAYKDLKIAPAPSLQTSSSSPTSSSQKRVFKVVDAADIRATPSKWQDRDIELRNVNVYWVDDDDIRILTKQDMTVFAKSFSGKDALYFKDNCETLRESMSNKCRATIRFSYERHGEDNPGGLSKRTVLISSDVEFVRPRRR